MADDQMTETETPDRTSGSSGGMSGDKPGGKRRKRRENPPPEELAQMDPIDWPPYRDPKGRRITGRQKRRALRALKAVGREAVNENHALHLVAQLGIDVYDTGRPSMLEVSAPAVTEIAPAGGQDVAVMENPDEHNMVTVPPTPQRADQTLDGTAETVEREAAIEEIQRDMIRRRRGRLRALLLRLFVCVALPTLAVAYYLTSIATPMYETEASFVIQTSENPAAGGGLGGLLAGTPFAGSQDSIVVQEFLTSREAFLRLNREFDYINHFKDPKIDVIQRLADDSSLDDAYAFFTDKVTIGYDPTEGIVHMKVVAATPQASQRFSEALVGYAEQRVDGLTQEARGDQLQVAEENYLKSEALMLDAERRVLDLQQQRGVLSAEVELSSQMSIISNLELELEKERLALAELLDNARPSQSRVDLQQQKIARLEERIADLRGDLTQTGDNDNSVSLARISGELRVAESELATRHLILQESIASMETARLEANRQVRYLSLAVAPVAPVRPTYPREVEGTILAFLTFLAIYIMVSLSLSILREQVSV